MSDLAERLHGIQTQQFINADPVSLVLTRATMVDDGAGGFTPGVPTELPAQDLRLVALRQPVEVMRTEGHMVWVDKMIVGAEGADIEKGDTFTDPVDGQEYEVLTVLRRPAWRVVAQVVSRG